MSNKYEMKNEYTLSEKELRQLQLIQLEMLQEVDRICKKCNIHYNIIAGTLLGAIRHGGYIPWDDDADIAMLRDEYNRFVEVIKTELNTDKYYFQDHNVTPGYRWGYGKLRRKNTVFLRKNQEHMPYEQGVFIDIFPLDYVSNYQIIRNIQNFKCFVYRKAMWSPVGRLIEKNPIYRLFYEVLYRIDDERFFESFNRYINIRNKKITDWVRILTFPTPNRRYGYLCRWYNESTDINFEDYVFQGIRDYDEYLSFKFGEYMSLPPENERKTHPVVELKLI